MASFSTPPPQILLNRLGAPAVAIAFDIEVCGLASHCLPPLFSRTSVALSRDSENGVRIPPPPPRDHTGLKKIAVVSPFYFQERVWHYPEIKNMAFESLAPRDHTGLKKTALVSSYYFRERAWHYRENKKIDPPPPWYHTGRGKNRASFPLLFSRTSVALSRD